MKNTRGSWAYRALNRAIAWDKAREKHKHLVDADQQEAVLSALDKRHNILMRDMARLSKAEYHGAGNELAAVNNALLKVEQAQADVLDQRRFNLGEAMLTPEGQLFREGEGFTLERWEEITPDIPISEKQKRALLNRMRVDMLVGLVAISPACLFSPHTLSPHLVFPSQITQSTRGYLSTASLNASVYKTSFSEQCLRTSSIHRLYQYQVFATHTP